MNHKSILPALVFLLICLISSAQTGKLKGKVVDQTHREPIPFVNIMVSDSTRQIAALTSDFEGNYSFDSLPVGKFFVKANFIGFEPYQNENVSIINGSTFLLDIVMKESTMMLEGVVVTAFRVPLIDKDRKSLGYAASSGDKSSPVKTMTEGSIYTMDNSEKIQPGQLTAGEINDFSKWTLWNDKSQEELSQHKKEWNISPSLRFSVFVQNQDGIPMVGEKVVLLDEKQNTVWAAQTDNIGKAELWVNLTDDIYPEKDHFSIMVNSEGEKYEIDKALQFHDGINQITINKTCDESNILDVVFVVDATGSMLDELNYLKVELNDVIQSVKTKNTDLSMRLGSVFYRDHGDDYVIQKTDLSEDISKTIGFIKTQHASGGGDFPEAVDEALDAAIHDLSWDNSARAKIIFLVLDAPPHQTPEILKKMQKIALDAAASGIKIVPVAASGIDKSTEYLMRSLALCTNGTYVFLTDHSGIGNKHIEPTTDKYEVEKLNTLLIRLFNQFSSVVTCKKELLNGDIFTVSDTMKIEGLTKSVNDSIPADDKEITKPLEKEFECKFYPNPTSGILNIEITGSINEIFLSDLSGKLLERFLVKGEKVYHINISQYPTGVYLITYFGDHNRPYSAKIILKK